MHFILVCHVCDAHIISDLFSAPPRTPGLLHPCLPAPSHPCSSPLARRNYHDFSLPCPEQGFVTNLFLAVLTQRLKILSNVEILNVLRGAVQKWRHPLEARAFGKWSMHWQAGQQALEMTILSKLDATKLDVYAAVVERMGYERGVFLGRSKPKAFRLWKGVAQESKAAKLAEIRRVQLQKEFSQTQEAAGLKNKDFFFTSCSNHLSLLKYQVYAWIMNVVLSDGLEHAVIQGVIVSTVLQAMEHDPESTYILLPPAVRPVVHVSIIHVSCFSSSYHPFSSTSLSSPSLCTSTK